MHFWILRYAQDDRGTYNTRNNLSLDGSITTEESILEYSLDHPNLDYPFQLNQFYISVSYL